MKNRTSRWPLVRTVGSTGVLLAGAIGIGPRVQADGAERPSLGRPVPVAAHATQAIPLGLAECLPLALQRQPRLAAHRASLAAAQDGLRALENLCIPTIIARELPVRRRQASLGVVAATAALDQAEQETVYAVTRTYFTVIYARQQEKVARSVVDRLTAIHTAASRSLKGGARDVTATDVDRTSVYLDMAQSRRLQAQEGVYRGLSALKEAIGLEPEYPLDVPAGNLPEPQLRIDRQEILAMALARRGELIQANAFVELTCLEIQAQSTSHRPRMETFAAGADIHSRQVPQENHDTEYRPGAVPPEMPGLLVGSRAERMQHARSLNERAAAMAEKARNLVALDADDAFRRWEGAAAKVGHMQKAATAGERLAENLRNDFTSGAKVKTEDVINAQVLTAQAQSQQNEALYQEILALADLERATAAGFHAASAWQAAQPAASKPKPKPKSAEPKLFDEPG